ncbi:MAG TPA: SpaH/EbpB family LPXTG-anchored major pilin [Candidatus Mediterraneibacter norwichensis]|nr:SpaH/EbpB family LPXTG-anchored major pilin [Candidatus Mediterraneibacter norwichensis]
MKRVKKNFMSRVLAVCLMLVMTLSMGMGVTAAQLSTEAKDNITISGIETTPEGAGLGTVNAYQVIDVNVSGNQPQSPVYTWSDGVAQWVSVNFRSYIDVDNSNAVTDAFLDLPDDSSQLKDFVDRLANAIRYEEDGNTAISLTPTEINLAEKTIEEKDGTKYITAEFGLGAYLFLVEGGVRIYSPGFAAVYPTTDENGNWVTAGHAIKVDLKSAEPGIDKTVSDYTYAIGQTVTYTLEVDVPDYPDNAVDKKFIIADYLSEGLTIDSRSIRIYNYSGDEERPIGTEITKSFVDYSFSEASVHPEEGVSPSFAKSFAGDYGILADKVIVQYNATVNEKAVVMVSTDTDNELDNKVYLIYNNNPYTEDGYREIPDEERVYTYALQVVKTGEEGDSMEGAEFTLKLSNSGENLQFVMTGAGEYRRPLPAETSGLTETLVTNRSGVISIEGLDLGDYILTETKAPAGYELPADPETEITLADDNNADGKPDGILNNDKDGTYEQPVVNTKPGFLPKTGGIGTAVFTVCGIVLMAGAVVLLVCVSRRKKH